MKPVLAFVQVTKTYPLSGDKGSRHALCEATFAVAAGQKIAIVGRSGSGKSTLLHLAAGIDVPTTGQVWVSGRELGRLSEGERTLFRRHEVGLIFQFFHLLSHLSVADNVALPAMIAGENGAASQRRVVELLDRVGLADRRRDPVQKLSGGEMQRVAICRALLRRPRLLLADEPTGNLDDDNGRRVMDLLLALADDEGAALLFVTHSREFARLADQVWELHSGQLVAGTEG